MNIAFYTPVQCCPQRGGVSRVTAILSHQLKEVYNHKIFSIYSSSQRYPTNPYKFDDTFIFIGTEESKSQLAEFIKRNDISILINQSDVKMASIFADINSHFGLNCKQIFGLHQVPGWNVTQGFNFKYLMWTWKKNKTKFLIKLLAYPIYKLTVILITRSQYKVLESKVDSIVFLSKTYYKLWFDFIHQKDTSTIPEKFNVIPNPLSFDSFATIDQISKKEKKVLIVSRMEESQKKISKAIQIWKKIQDNGQYQDWHLDIVGEGPDIDTYIQIVSNQKIPNVTFYGSQPPEFFYRRSALFMMTSDMEAWGMILTEASQFGVVPIAFNTYSALNEIITDGENGFILNKNDLKGYQHKMQELMLNSDERLRVAVNAVENAKRFVAYDIVKMWNNLFTKLFSPIEKSSKT